MARKCIALHGSRSISTWPLQVPLEGHRLGPLAGLTISSTGHGSDEKGELAKLIELGGGVYSGSLTKQCTHLVLKHTDDGKVSAKEKCAVGDCLSAPWLTAAACHL